MLIFLGALPDPLHGMSSINKKMLSALNVNELSSFNLVPSYAARFYPGIIFTMVKVCHLAIIFFPFLIKLFRHRHQTNIYFSIAGGMGKAFDLPFMLVCGLWAKTIFVHHHSFAYCNRYDALFNKLIVLGKGKIVHIALCQNMKDRLVNTYHVDENNVEVLSNAAFFDASIANEEHKKLSSLGFISNISFEKGIREFVETFAMIKKTNPHLRGVIAGPCLDHAVQEFVDKSCAEISGLQYVGAVYGEAKNTFFSSIDVLLFPTNYVNEAEPLTIYEAFASGIPVIAWARGCISGMIAAGGGQVIESDNEFVPAAVKTLLLWLSDDGIYQQQALLAKQRFALHQKNSRLKLQELIARLLMVRA